MGASRGAEGGAEAGVESRDGEKTAWGHGEKLWHTEGHQHPTGPGQGAGPCARWGGTANPPPHHHRKSSSWRLPAPAPSPSSEGFLHQTQVQTTAK